MPDPTDLNVQDNQSLDLLAAVKGGRTTNSPPANWSLLQTEKGYALSSGVDKLVLAVDLFWRSTAFFKVLDQLKQEAVAKECSMPGLLHSPEHGFTWPFQVSAFGKDGYQWLLTSPEFAIKLGNWIQPKSRPSAMIEISSEALWMQGVVEAIDKILTLLNHAGGHASSTKVSRIDLCLDLLAQAKLWSPALRDYAVTKSRKKSNHDSGSSFSGFEFGRGHVQCRMYDKALEIAQKSKKFWFYDIWNINEDELPDELRVIRIEFQLRREALKELGLNTVWEFTNHPRSLWAYCVEWLKFTDDPSKDPREQETLPFWKTVQEGFMGGQCGHPLIRAKAVNIKKKQLAQQLVGQLTSLIVIDTDEFAPQVTLDDQHSTLDKTAALIGMDDAALSERVRRKQGKYLRAIEKYKNAEVQRKELGLPQMKKSQDGNCVA
jgi:hypothetical protein